MFLQADGHGVVHRDLAQLVHIGGVSHYLSPGGYHEGDDGEPEPDWARWPGDPTRYQVAHFTATTLKALLAGRPAPAVPADTRPALVERLELVRGEMSDLVACYADP